MQNFRFLSMAQIGALTLLNVKTLPRRIGTSAAAVAGIAGVVAVLVSVLSIAQGFQRAMVRTGSDDVAMVMRSGADSEMTSGLSRAETRIIADAPQIRQGAEGPAASAELFVVINLPKRSTGTDANVPLRGVQPAAFVVRNSVRMVAGRRFEPGKNEVIVGRGAAATFAGLDLGKTLRVGRQEWKITGIFVADGGLAESEIWTDAEILQAAYRRGDVFQSVYAGLNSADAFTEFKDALTTDPRLNVKVIRQSDYYAEQSRTLVQLITQLGTLVAGLMALGAVFGALNTMYTAVTSRTREVATLRAIGFGAMPVVVSVLLESFLLAAIGGVLGGGAAYWAFDGFRAATLNWQSFSQVTFAFAVTPSLLVRGAVYSMGIGLVGGLFPALRAARMPVADALRAN